MNIVDIHFLPGRNIYSHRPVMKMLLNLSKLRNTRSDSILAEQLLAMLPGLTDHYCSRRRPGGFVERLGEGTYLGHVVEHVFLELQSLCGLETEYGKTINRDDGITEVICEYRCQQVAQYLAPAAVKVVLAAVSNRSLDLSVFIKKAKKIADEFMPGPSTSAIIAAARRREIPVQSLEDGSSFYRLGTGKYQKRIMASISEATGCIPTEIAANKQLTKKILSQLGMPVPQGIVVQTREEAREAAEVLGYPLAVKPIDGNQGKGVTLQISSILELDSAFACASALGPQVLVEKYLKGRHFRILVVGQNMAAAAERIPAHVTGDGTHTVSELIEQENSNPLRGTGHEKPLTIITVDKIVVNVLAKQGLSQDTVPEKGRQVWLRQNDNLSTGGTARDVTDEIHPLQAELAVRAARAVGLDICGVDIIMQDITQPPDVQEGGIIEVNAAPGLRMHLFPSEGMRRDVGKIIVDHLFPPGVPNRVPVFSVTGTNGKTTTVRMLDFAMRRHGLYSGLCCTDGIYFNGKIVQKGDLTGPASAQAVLACPDVEVAVLETARGGIIRRGLGYDCADVGVICNIRDDHLGQDGLESLSDLVYVKSLVAEAVYSTGTVVLNADDPHAHEIASSCWAGIIYFSMQGNNIIVRRHLGNGGKAVFVRRGMILAARGSRVTVVGRVRDFAVTLGGKAVHQVENLLGALSALWGYGLSPRQAGLYLRDFASSVNDNPGRANLYDVGGIRILVDYGHNADGIAKMGELARKLRPNRLIGVVGVPGDRSDELIERGGRAAGSCFDYLFIKEDEDLRGRKPKETANLLLRGALSAGLGRDRIVVQPDERLAVVRALGVAKPGDLVVVFFEKLEPVIGQIFALHTETQKLQQEPTICSMALDNPVSLS